MDPMYLVNASFIGRVFCWSTVLSIALLPAELRAQTDDFNDGNDTGWSHYEPLKAFGAGASYSASGGLYRLSAPPSPAPAELGVQRIGSVRMEKQYTRVRVQTEITGWNDDINQALGVIARAGSLGLGTTTGYTYNYNTRSGFHQINLVQNEQATREVNESPFRLNPADRYRMDFQLVGSLMLGRLYSITNSAVPLHSVIGFDENFESGVSGVFAFALDADAPLDARFDNFSAEVPEVLRATLLDSNPAIGEIPVDPVSQLDVRIANAETEILRESIVLEVNGAVSDYELLEEPASFRLVHRPSSALEPSAAHSVRLTFRDQLGVQVFAWGFGVPAPAPVTLVSSETPTGPFLATPAAVLDPVARSFRVPMNGASRFFRIVDSVQRRVVGVKIETDQLVLSFE